MFIAYYVNIIMEDKIKKNNESVAQVPLPNSTAVLVLGILSIVCCFCYGVIGLVLAIIALSLAKKSNSLYNKSPDNYKAESFSNLKAGRICAIIGLILSALYLVFIVLYIMLIALAVVSEADMPWELL